MFLTEEEIGLVIIRSSQVERLLRRRGAAGTGLRELAESIDRTLTPEMRDLLCYIGSIRNRAAHEGDAVDIDEEELTLFARACDAVLNELREENSTGEFEIPGNQPVPRLKPLFLIPGFHLLFPLILLCRAFRDVLMPLTGILTQAAGVWTALVSLKKAEWLFMPAAVLLLAAGTLSVQFCRTPVLPALRFVPVANCFFMLHSIIAGIDYMKLFAAVTLLLMPYISFVLCFRLGENTAALILLGISYAGTLLCQMPRIRRAL